MKLNKNTPHTLLCILNGNTTAIKISEQLTNITVRSIQRALVDLTSGKLITRHGTNNPHYSINYNELLSADIPDKLLENEQRPSSKLNHNLINHLGSQSTEDLESLFGNTKNVKIPTNNGQITAKELEYLTIELSWKSSALEGNTYTLLDTQLLLSEGIKAKNKTEFETQMILNHKNAIVFIIENKELFTNNIEFESLEELHRIIGYNLGIDSSVRKKSSGLALAITSR